MANHNGTNHAVTRNLACAATTMAAVVVFAAAGALAAVPSVPPVPAPALAATYQPAALAIENGNYDGATTALTHMVPANDREALLAFAYSLKGDKLRAFYYSRRIKNLDDAAYDVSSFYLDHLGDPQSSKAVLSMAATAVPSTDGRGVAWLAGLYSSRGNHDEALKVYSIGHEAFPKNASLADGLGQEYLLRGDPDRAIVYFTRAHLAEPNAPLHLVGLGQAFEMAGRPDKALDLWNKALVMDPSNSALYAEIQRLQTDLTNGPHAAVGPDSASVPPAGAAVPAPDTGAAGSQASVASAGPAANGGIPATATATPATTASPAVTQAAPSGNAALEQILGVLKAWLRS